MSNQRIPKSSRSKIGQYSLVSKFKGYHACEDQTMLTPDILVSPSKNVVMKTSGRLSLVKGYSLDGAASTTIDSGILSNYDFTNVVGTVLNTRAGFLTVAGNDGKLQYAYRSGATVTWKDLMTSLTNVRLSYTNYWDNSELIALMLWVDGSNNVYEWNGAVTTIASATATTLTKQGTTTWAQAGFYKARNKSIVVDGTTYTYTGGETTTTLTGLSADLSAKAVGTVVHQLPVTNALSGFTSILATFGPTVIGCGRKNQVYYGASNSNTLYVSKTNNFKDCSYATPRVAGDGMLLTLPNSPRAFIPQEVRETADAYDMYISCGNDTWAIARLTLQLSTTAANESFEVIILKTSPLQGAKSERLAAKMKNHILFIGNDNVCNMFGYMSYQYVPAISDISYPIVDDMSSYDMTDASIFYQRNYIYLAIPKAGVMRIYNMTDQTQEQYSGLKAMEDVTQMPWFWEAPITYPISGFYTVNGELYGHSYTTSESYKLFDGGSFNGQQIDANATFAYDDKNDRTQSKASSEIWIEGYIKQNTTLNATVTGDLDAFASAQTVTVNGADNTIVAYGSGGHALGKNPLGSQPLGGAQTVTNTLPAWFHVSKTYGPVAFYLEQISFDTKGVDLQWELVAFGTMSEMTSEGNNFITQ